MNERTKLLTWGSNEREQYIVSSIAKRTYKILDNGSCILNDEQYPLCEELVYYDEGMEVLALDLETYPYKPGTDLIIKGSATTSKNATQFISNIKLDGIEFPMLISGKRSIYKNVYGTISFSDSEKVDSVPLTFYNAYGGFDRWTEELLEPTNLELLSKISPDIDWRRGSDSYYPRNPAGKGFVIKIQKNTLAEMELPQIEDPKDVLKAEELEAGSYENWYKMPISKCPDCVSPAWFHRYALFGMPPIHSCPKGALTEMKRGWIPADLFDNPEREVDQLASMSAALGLQLKRISGGEQIYLSNIIPGFPEFIITLPVEKPSMSFKLYDNVPRTPAPLIYSIVVNTEDRILNIVWGGTSIVKRPFLPNELDKYDYNVKW